MKILALVSPAGSPHARMAAEALKRSAGLRRHRVRVESGDIDTLSRIDVADADLVIIASDVPLADIGFEGIPVHSVRLAEAIRATTGVLDNAERLVAPAAVEAPAVEAPAVEVVPAPIPPPTLVVAGSLPDVTGKRLVGITSCPTGIAHTFMAAEALQKAAVALGHSIKVETQGSVGAKNQLTAEDIADADAVVIAADTKVDISRFAGKRLYMTGTKQAMKGGRDVVTAALDAPEAGGAAHAETGARRERTGPYKHLMTGVSYMLPVVIAGGLAIALAFALGGIYAGDVEGSLAWALNRIGGETAFHLFVAVLSAFIAYSIADRPGIAAGLVGGMLAQSMGAGFLGGIVAGFIAGYLTKFLADNIRLPATLEGLKPVLILPFISTIAVGLLMIYVVAPPVEALNIAMNEWLLSMRGANAILLGLLLGSMMAFDMGGPANKAAYTFAVGLLASKIYTPMAAVMAAGITPPLGLALAALIFRNRFDREEREAAGASAVLGLSFITEGAIPFAAKDPLRVIPALIIGSAAAGAISMASGVQLLVPHGGIFAILIPGAVTNLLAYLGAIAAGTLITTATLFVLKKVESPESGSLESKDE